MAVLPYPAAMEVGVFVHHQRCEARFFLDVSLTLRPSQAMARPHLALVPISAHDLGMGDCVQELVDLRGARLFVFGAAAHGADGGRVHDLADENGVATRIRPRTIRRPSF